LASVPKYPAVLLAASAVGSTVLALNARRGAQREGRFAAAAWRAALQLLRLEEVAYRGRF
jgi:hypothetical protein